MERFTFSLAAEFNSVEMVRKRIRGVLLASFGNRASASIDDFCQIVSELVNNGVEHGGCTTIEGELLIDRQEASFTLATRGVSFDPTAVGATMPDFDQQDELPEGGYGLAIIRQLADRFTYRYLDGMNMTTVAKAIHTQESQGGDHGSQS